jgi:hypothetical protein
VRRRRPERWNRPVERRSRASHAAERSVELNLGTGASGEAASAAAQETEARAAKTCLERPAVAGPSLEAVVERENLKKALAQVKRKGRGRCRRDDCR